MVWKTVKEGAGTGRGSGGSSGGSGVGDGGGGGAAGGSKSDVSFTKSAESVASATDGGSDLHWLLPNIVEAIEILEGATAQEVQSKIEELTSIKYSNTDLTSGLENGTYLGLFEVKREFSLNRQYLNSKVLSDKEKEFVLFIKKRLKEEYDMARSKNPTRDKKDKSKGIRKNLTWVETGKKKKSRQKMCHRCKKRVKIIEESKSDAESYTSASIQTLKSDKSKSAGKRHARQEKSPSKRRKELSPSPQEYFLRAGNHQPDNASKSKLLVETNPLKKEPPDLMFM